MRFRAPWLLSLLLAPVGLGAGDLRPLPAIRVEGGHVDDQRFALAALGLKAGQNWDPATLPQALAAVRLVDRFRKVEGELAADGSLRLRLEPLAPLVAWSWEGDPVPAALRKTLLPELRRGQRVGPQRRLGFAALVEQRLREAGYRQGHATLLEAEGGRSLRIQVTLGAPSRVREVRFEGNLGAYSRETLLKVANLEPGVSIWTPSAIRDAQRKLRDRFVKDGRLEGSVRLAPVPHAEEVLLLDLNPGPVVRLEAQGLGFFAPLWGQPRLAEFVPLARAERYTPSLLDEGAARITTYFRDQGYPEAKVGYTRTVTAGPAERPEAVTISYVVEPGPQRTIARVFFEGHAEVPESELLEATRLPRRRLFLAPYAKAEVVKGLEDRLTNLYLQKGYPDVRVRRRVDTAKDGSVEVRFFIREGRRRSLDSFILELPADPAFPREGLAQSLLEVLGEHPRPREGGVYQSDRKHLQGYEGRLELTPEGARLSFKPALPWVRNDLALVVSDLRQRLLALGSANPKVSLTLEEGGEYLPVVRIQVPVQPLDQTRRLVVQGSDATRAEAVLRESSVVPGRALDPLKLDDEQIQLGRLGAFQRVDLLTLKDLPGQAAEPWQRGDLALRLQERSPWVFSEGFGYDKTQGYHIGLGAQRLNVGGMGRTLDFSARAGDQTLNNPALRRMFPTGEVKRSVDSYSVGFTDPWLLGHALDGWLSPRTRFRAEAAYIEEAQAAFFARRRRFTPSLEWKIGEQQTVQLGYRFERVEVASNTDSRGVPLIADQDLFLIARTPSRSVISAPFLQVLVDRRDRPFDPTSGTYFLGRLEFANQLFGTSGNSSFVKLDVRHQWNWPIGFHAEAGVLMANVRLGLARPTARSAEDLPLTERFFGGGSFTVRGVEPDMLGDIQRVDSKGVALAQPIPLGGQGLAVINLEYRFPLFGMQSLWGEIFADSGQVYRSLLAETDPLTGKRVDPTFAPLRTTLGLGLILKLGFPLKLEYATDTKRIFGRPRTQSERDTQLKSLLVSAGYQF